MIHWSDDGFVLSARKHGENGAIISLLTREHGRHAGLVHGGVGRKQRGVLQIGNRVAANWRARLAEHLGTYTCELIRTHAAGLLSERIPLLALRAATALIDETLPEREPNGEVFDDLEFLLGALCQPGWEAAYVRWEFKLLTELGFGLDLSTCAATGATEGLCYVSPRTGRAISAAAGEPYRERLLPLPQFLNHTDADPDIADINDGLRLTGHFLDIYAFTPERRDLSRPRRQLVDALGAATPTSGTQPSE